MWCCKLLGTYIAAKGIYLYVVLYSFYYLSTLILLLPLIFIRQVAAKPTKIFTQYPPPIAPPLIYSNLPQNQCIDST